MGERACQAGADAGTCKLYAEMGIGVSTTENRCQVVVYPDSDGVIVGSAKQVRKSTDKSENSARGTLKSGYQYFARVSNPKEGKIEGLNS